VESEIVRASGRRVLGQSRPGAQLRDLEISSLSSSGCPAALGRFRPTASLKCPQMICTGEDVRHPPYKTQIAARPFGEDGWMKCRGAIN
jgi:hypothetical protein